jgi:hypothetical protein
LFCEANSQRIKTAMRLAQKLGRSGAGGQTLQAFGLFRHHDGPCSTIAREEIERKKQQVMPARRLAGPDRRS